MKFKIPWYIKLLATLLLLGLLVKQFPLGEIYSHLRHTHIGWVIVTILLGEAVMVNQAFRWRHMLLVPEAAKPPFSAFFHYTAIGYFFNVCLPGGMGGDAVKSIAFGKNLGHMHDSIASVAMARLLGLLALTALFWLGLLSGQRTPASASLFMVLATLAQLAMLALLAYNPATRWLLASRFSLARKGGAVLERMQAYRHNPSKTWVGLLDSLAMQLIFVTMQWCYFQAAGLDLPWTLALVIVPVSTLATMIPITFYGVGVREWTMLALVPASLDSRQVLSSVLLGYVVVFVQALQGALLFALKRPTPAASIFHKT